MLKKLFHTYNSILLILYLYPGSILGFLLYKDFYKQPQLTSDFLSISISSNHFYAFLLLAFLGFWTFKYNKFFFIYLLLVSTISELSHLIIPNRTFQFSDLFGNMLGVLVAIFVLILFNLRKKL